MNSLNEVFSLQARLLSRARYSRPLHGLLGRSIREAFSFRFGPSRVESVVSSFSCVFSLESHAVFGMACLDQSSADDFGLASEVLKSESFRACACRRVSMQMRVCDLWICAQEPESFQTLRKLFAQDKDSLPIICSAVPGLAEPAGPRARLSQSHDKEAQTIELRRFRAQTNTKVS